MTVFRPSCWTISKNHGAEKYLEKMEWHPFIIFDILNNTRYFTPSVTQKHHPHSAQDSEDKIVKHNTSAKEVVSSVLREIYSRAWAKFPLHFSGGLWRRYGSTCAQKLDFTKCTTKNIDSFEWSQNTRPQLSALSSVEAWGENFRRPWRRKKTPEITVMSTIA